MEYQIVKERFHNQLLTKEEYSAMLPAKIVEAGRYYEKFIVHQQ